MASKDERREKKMTEPGIAQPQQKKVRAEGERPEEMIHENRTDGPSYISDVDRMAMSGDRTEWQEPTAPAAGDPLSEDELRGLSVLGGSDIRDGAIPGVSDPIRDGTGGPQERPDPDATIQGGTRRNPPLVEDVAVEDGGISMSGGAAGGDRGHGGSSNRANPAEESKGGPAEYRPSSRFDLDRTLDRGGDEAR